MTEKTMWVWHDSRGEVESVDVSDGRPSWSTCHRFAQSYNRIVRSGVVMHVLGLNDALTTEDAIKHARSYTDKRQDWVTIKLGSWWGD